MISITIPLIIPPVFSSEPNTKIQYMVIQYINEILIQIAIAVGPK